MPREFLFRPRECKKCTRYSAPLPQPPPSSYMIHQPVIHHLSIQHIATTTSISIMIHQRHASDHALAAARSYCVSISLQFLINDDKWSSYKCK